MDARWIAVVAAFALPMTPALAVNVAFMPGDAFFHAYLSDETLASFGEDGIVLRYVYPPDSITLCGYAGFPRLQIDGDTSGLTRNTRALFDARRSKQTGKQYVNSVGGTSEFDGFWLLVYNRSFKWSRRSFLGLKYNESWASLPEEAFDSDERPLGFGHVKAERFTTFVPLVTAVAHEWRYSAEVPTLDVGIPEGVGWGVSGPKIEAVARVQADEVQLVVVPEPALGVYFRRKPGSEFFAITAEGVTHWVVDERGDLQSSSWKPAAAAEKD